MKIKICPWNGRWLIIDQTSSNGKLVFFQSLFNDLKWRRKPASIDSGHDYKTREEAELHLKKWFETQPPEVFAEYIAQRMKGKNFANS